MTKMRKTKFEEMDSLAETDRLVMVKQWIELASIPITIAVTGREGDKGGRRQRCGRSSL